MHAWEGRGSSHIGYSGPLMDVRLSTLRLGGDAGKLQYLDCARVAVGASSNACASLGCLRAEMYYLCTLVLGR